MPREGAEQESYRLLSYEQQMVQEMLDEDALCIMAAGLGWHRVVAAMLRMQDNAAGGEHDTRRYHVLWESRTADAAAHTTSDGIFMSTYLFLLPCLDTDDTSRNV